LANRRIKKIEPEQKLTSKSNTQIIESKRRLEAAKLNSSELVTNVRVGFVARESSRRIDDVKKTDYWDGKRRDTQNRSSNAQQDITKHWEKVLNKNHPYQLHQVYKDEPLMVVPFGAKTSVRCIN
jgi:hypothetical protein